MSNKDIIKMYQEGLSIRFIARKYYQYNIFNDTRYHTIEYKYSSNKKYTFADAIIYVQDLIIKYYNGYFD